MQSPLQSLLSHQLTHSRGEHGDNSGKEHRSASYKAEIVSGWQPGNHRTLWQRVRVGCENGRTLGLWTEAILLARNRLQDRVRTLGETNLGSRHMRTVGPRTVSQTLWSSVFISLAWYHLRGNRQRFTWRSNFGSNTDERKRGWGVGGLRSRTGLWSKQVSADLQGALCCWSGPSGLAFLN